jgi:hypothetical protein
MRPARFQDFLASAVKKNGAMRASTYGEAGITRSLYGLILTGPVRASVQIAARSALGDDYAQPERIVTGEPHPHIDSADPSHLEGAEQYLAALIIDVVPHEIASVSLYHLRAKRGAIRYGFTVDFHDGSAIFCYVSDP